MYKAARNRPLKAAEKVINQKISRFRGKVERAFGTLKRDYGLFRCRYLGRVKTELQFMLSATAFNLKKAVRMMA